MLRRDGRLFRRGVIPALVLSLLLAAVMLLACCSALAEGVKLASAVPGEGNAPAARSEKKKGAKQ